MCLARVRQIGDKCFARKTAQYNRFYRFLGGISVPDTSFFLFQFKMHSEELEVLRAGFNLVRLILLVFNFTSPGNMR